MNLYGHIVGDAAAALAVDQCLPTHRSVMYTGWCLLQNRHPLCTIHRRYSSGVTTSHCWTGTSQTGAEFLQIGAEMKLDISTSSPACEYAMCEYNMLNQVNLAKYAASGVKRVGFGSMLIPSVYDID